MKAPKLSWYAIFLLVLVLLAWMSVWFELGRANAQVDYCIVGYGECLEVLDTSQDQTRQALVIVQHYKERYESCIGEGSE
jgi:alpha-D-ribose 1-methylphosphonate 5-phosphate C-P lyase